MTMKLRMWVRREFGVPDMPQFEGFWKCIKSIRTPLDAWDTFIAYFVPHRWLHLHRRIRYGRR